MGAATSGSLGIIVHTSVDTAPSEPAGRGLRGRRRGADDGERDRDGVPVRDQPDHRDLGQFDVRDDRDALLHALSGPEVHGGDEADQPRFRGLGSVVRGRGDHDPRGIGDRVGHRRGLRGEDEAGGGALPDLGDPDERVAPVRGWRKAALIHLNRSPLPWREGARGRG